MFRILGRKFLKIKKQVALFKEGFDQKPDDGFDVDWAGPPLPLDHVILELHLTVMNGFFQDVVLVKQVGRGIYLHRQFLDSKGTEKLLPVYLRTRNLLKL